VYSIGQVSKLTGITAFALRYYEKIGLLPQPRRQDGKPHGVRVYDDRDLQFINFIHGLRDAGMKLDDIASFVEGGCLLTQDSRSAGVRHMLRRRISILEQHVGELERQIARLQALKSTAQDKKDYYAGLLTEDAPQ
jgi:DNA-binding transcriptional MerR regulator